MIGLFSAGSVFCSTERENGSATYQQASPLYSHKGKNRGNPPYLPDRKDDVMHAVLWFVLGSMFGGFFGIALMCMLQINRPDDYDDEEEWE